MKRMTAFVLAAALVTVGVPTLAHEAAYPSECDDRQGRDECQMQNGEPPAHNRCTGERDHMVSDDDSLISRSLGFAVSEDQPVEAYIHAVTDEPSSGDGLGTLMPGILWIETNGFSGLQRTDWECMSPAHEEPNEWETHADKVLI